IPTGIASVTINGVEYTASQPPTFPAGTSISMKAVAADNNYTLDYSEVKAIPKDASATDTSATFPLKGGNYTVTSNVTLTISEPYYMADASTLSDALSKETHIVIDDKADLTSEVPKGKTLLVTGNLVIDGSDGQAIVNNGTIINYGYLINNGKLFNNGYFLNTGTMNGSGGSIVNNRTGVLTNLSYLTCGDFTNDGTFNNGSIATDGDSGIRGTTDFSGDVINRSALNNLNGFVSFSGKSVTNNGIIKNSSFSEDSSASSSKKPMFLSADTTLINATVLEDKTAAFHNYGSLTNNGKIVNEAGATFCNYGPKDYISVEHGDNFKLEETQTDNTNATLQGGKFSGTLLCSKAQAKPSNQG
ncbi:MAG: hypothetical protein IJV64_07300, partial [Oscillospiraceae bacterium]|nr:hypothetical protein [Oscillospiraceae bacterium]